MLLVVLVCLVLLVVTTVIHYEVLRGLSSLLPMLQMRSRAKLIVVILATFIAHAVEITLYALALYGLVHFAGLGTLDETSRFSLDVSLYFSAETFTSLGYGDVLPGGAVRLLAGAEALNGLLLIGWSASYAYIAMERFWSDGNGHEA
jgi:hypothetical protein